MATFAQLKTRVKDYLIDVPTKTDALVGAWINRAVRVAEEQHNFRHMEALHEATTTVSTRKLDDKPSDWKENREPPYFLREDGSTREMAWSPSGTDMRRQFDVEDTDDQGDPDFLLETETELHVFPFPDGASDWDSDFEYRIKVPYWAYTAELVNDGDTNWFTDKAEWYVTFFAVAEGLLFNRDTQEATLYLERAATEYGRVRTVDKRARALSPRQLVPRVGVFGPARKPPRKI